MSTAPGRRLPSGALTEERRMTLVLRYAARSDRGLIRGNNQDSVYAGPRLLAVADGMGGHAAGDVASKVVIAALAHLDDDRPSGDLSAGAARGRLRGATSTCARSSGSPRSSRAWARRSPRSCSPAAGSGWCHVGDSRAYLLRDGAAHPDHPRRHVRADADRRGPDHRGGGQQPPAALAAPARAERRRTSSRTSPCARPAPATATCSAPTACPACVSEETLAEALQDPDPHESPPTG